MTFPTFRLDDARARKVLHFDLSLGDADLAAIKADLGVIDLKKVRLAGELRPVGRGDWELSARFGATYVQPCVVTLAPVTTRVDTAVARLFVTELPEPEPGDEVEIPEDDRLDLRPSLFAPLDLLHEVLALEMPQWPRASGAELPPEFAGDSGNKPFAGLADLKAALDAKTKG